MKKELFRKGLVLGIIFLFIGLCFNPSTGTKVEKATIFDSKSGGYIQDLIDNASDGDTINIPSGIYYENIVIDKSISLIGEDKETTIIDGGSNVTVIRIVSNKVTVSGFTIQNGDDGVELYRSNRNSIKGNTIISNKENGINIMGSALNIISGNNINSNNATGIFLCVAGGFFPLTPSSFNIIKGNNISNNEDGIYLLGHIIAFIIKNNFIDNKRDAYFEDSSFSRWRRNYWNESRNIPKLIFGERWIGLGGFVKNVKWINVDWFPAKEPYDI